MFCHSLRPQGVTFCLDNQNTGLTQLTGALFTEILCLAVFHYQPSKSGVICIINNLLNICE